LIGIAPLLLGLPIYFASKRRLALGERESPLLVSGSK
jgi:hypothetical protein